MVHRGKWSRRRQQSTAGGAVINAVSMPEAMSPAAAWTQRTRYRQLGTERYTKSACGPTCCSSGTGPGTPFLRMCRAMRSNLTPLCTNAVIPPCVVLTQRVLQSHLLLYVRQVQRHVRTALQRAAPHRRQPVQQTRRHHRRRVLPQRHHQRRRQPRGKHPLPARPSRTCRCERRVQV